MNIIVCVDNRMGTMFNHRRLSRDSVLCQRVASLVGDARLFLNAYSYELFKDFYVNIIQSEHFLSVAGKGDYCFEEGENLLPFAKEVESIILFRWNRDYPSDKKLDIDLSKDWILNHVEEFKGSSHEKITMEHYVRG